MKPASISWCTQSEIHSIIETELFKKNLLILFWPLESISAWIVGHVRDSIF